MPKAGIRTLTIFLLAASLVAAQSSSDWNALKALAPGTQIRVDGAPRPVRGQMQSVNDDTIVLRSGSRDTTITRTQVTRVAVKKPGHRGRNVLIGAGIGGASGAGIGIAANSCTGLGCIGAGAVAIAAPLVLGTLGALIGLVIPSGGWRVLYSSPSASGPAGGPAPPPQ